MDTTALLIGSVSGVFLFITLYNMLKGKLFWVADLGLDLLLTIAAPMILGSGTAAGAFMALAFGVAFTSTLRIAHMYMPGEYLRFVVEKGWPRLRWIPVPPKKFQLRKRTR